MKQSPNLIVDSIVLPRKLDDGDGRRVGDGHRAGAAAEAGARWTLRWLRGIKQTRKDHRGRARWAARSEGHRLAERASAWGNGHDLAARGHAGQGSPRGKVPRSAGLPGKKQRRRASAGGGARQAEEWRRAWSENQAASGGTLVWTARSTWSRSTRRRLEREARRSAAVARRSMSRICPREAS